MSVSEPKESAEPGGSLVALRSQLGRIHHDLSNPVAIIMGNAQLLGMMALPDEAAACVKDLEAAGMQLRSALLALEGLRKTL